ncbi:serine/threonine protein kinase [Sphaerimonospora thailandensis]|uniref:Protein kinase domain-containing protein n=1 Tax=Sphaerimonospora thailandensis TaxID=795644 RepID=A0A8J3W1Z3_9ACTN|nr:serine/threonine-protein kinase [Sphaerimonospora thailandensis]GIH72618.1 hypothetical protein Mth01_48710 [Sphaerimonospora thailandensis]
MLPLLAGDPQEIGPYRIVGRLGAGGMGVVYAAVDGAGQRVAVKLVHEALSIDLEFRRRFSREISVLRGVEGACLARMFDADPGTERPWLATEFIPGPTLEQHVQAEGPVTGDALTGLAAGLAEALVAMHAAGVVHRDLKPSNVILSPQGPRLIDFGIAKVLDETSMTHTGTLIGSPGWISPEEYGDGRAGTPADVYGWALLVLYATTGEPPYGTGRPEVLAYRVREETPDIATVPEELREIVGRALAKDPAERPTADEALVAVTASRPDAEDDQARESFDITSFIQRTWVLPQQEAPENTDWPQSGPLAAASPTPSVPSAPEPEPEPAASASPTGPIAAQSIAVRPTGVGKLPDDQRLVMVARRSGPSWVHAYVATAAAVTVIAVAAIVATSSAERSTPTAAAQTPSAPPVTTPASLPTVTPSPSLTPTPLPEPVPTRTPKKRKPRFTGKRVSFQGITTVLPKGWRMFAVGKDYACIESPRSVGSGGPWDFTCRPDAMALVVRSSNDGWPGFGIQDNEFGFMWGQHVPCLTGGSVIRDPYGSYAEPGGDAGFYYGIDPYGSRLVHSGLAKMGDGRKAYYREWQVACEVNLVYTMKIWHLPQSKVSLYVLSARPEDGKGHRQIIASMDLRGYRHAAKV